MLSVVVHVTFIFLVSDLDFAVVAKISLPGPSLENEGGDKKAKGTSATRAEVLQALRTKCNALIFQKERPTYHKGIFKK